MRRLVTAVTGLLTLIGVGVVAGYLLVFSAHPDRAARLAPADTAIYVNIYLQPSTGQKLNLFELIGRLPGFRDPASLEQKIHDVAQSLLGDLGLDYAADVRPWLGNQLAVAIAPPAEPGGPPAILLLASVRDLAVASEAAPRLATRDGAEFTPEAYRGAEAMIGETVSYALLPDLLVVANSPAGLRAALDAERDVSPSLADGTDFAATMRDLPADHLASVYLDLRRVVSAAGDEPIGGFATGALALVAEPSGLHLDGTIPFDAAAAGESARRAFSAGDRPATLSAWMSAETRAEAIAFGLRDRIDDLEQRLSDEGTSGGASDALEQLRALAAIGLGINLDRDLLPLLDGEAAVALQSIDASGPGGQLLLQPTDPAAAQAALDRMRAALVERGSSVGRETVRGVAITTIEVPRLASLAYAVVDGVVVIGLASDDVAASVEAHADGRTLAASSRYAAAFELLGGRAGDELWVDIPGLLDAATEIVDPGSEFRDILHQIGELAAAASAQAGRLEVHSVLTVR